MSFHRVSVVTLSTDRAHERHFHDDEEEQLHRGFGEGHCQRETEDAEITTGELSPLSNNRDQAAPVGDSHAPIKSDTGSSA